MILGGAEADHRSTDVLVSVDVVVISSSCSGVVLAVVVVVVVPMTRGGAETSVTLASVVSGLVLER